MTFIRLLGAALVAASVGGGAVAQSGANRLLSASADGSWTTTQDNFLEPTALNGFGLIVSGDFGFGPAEQVFLLNREGSNRILYQDASRTWNATQDNFLEPSAVNGFELAVSGEFGFGPGEEVFLLNREGANRFVHQSETGTWTQTQDNFIAATGVNGFTILAAGDFGFGEGEEIFLLNRDGANRVLFRAEDGSWGATQDDLMPATGVNGFEIAVAGDFGFGEGDEIFLLNRDGANRVLYRTDDGAWAATQDDFVAATGVNGFTQAVAGDFGFGEGDEIFLLNRDGANRVVYRNPDGAWTQTQDNFMAATALNGFSKIAAGHFTDGPYASIFLID